MTNSLDYTASFSRTAARGGSDGAVNATNPEGRTSSKTAPPRLEGGADEDDDDTALFKVCACVLPPKACLLLCMIIFFLSWVDVRSSPQSSD